MFFMEDLLIGHVKTRTKLEFGNHWCRSQLL